MIFFFFFFSSRRRHTRLQGDWSSDVCSSDLGGGLRDLQADGLDGDPRLRHGAPRGARELRRGQRALHGVRLGHGPGPHRDGSARDSRHPAAVRERRAVPRAIRRGHPMIVSRRWLEALLGGAPLDARDAAERLTAHVAAVDAVVPIHGDLGDIVIARVIEVKKHPNADRLSLCLVDAGGGSAVEVVCGAPNVRAGKSYPYAPVGAVLPGGVKLERKTIRGVESNGMLCSAKELGLGEDHAGILEVDTSAAPGTRFTDVVPVADHQIVIDVPASRPDLLCHKGVARELGASLAIPVKLPLIPGSHGIPVPSFRREEREGVVDSVAVRLEDPEGAPRYMIAVIRGVRVGESPAWLADRLAAVGQRPINNVVDATNYVLLELNQPLHAFDLAKLRGPAVVVRRARPAEQIVTLDGVARTLTPEMTASWASRRSTSGPSPSRSARCSSAPSASPGCSAWRSRAPTSSGTSRRSGSSWRPRRSGSPSRCPGGAPT